MCRGFSPVPCLVVAGLAAAASPSLGDNSFYSPLHQDSDANGTVQDSTAFIFRVQRITTQLPEIDTTRTLVFFADREIEPPYKVTGERIEGEAFIYINGVQVEPSKRRWVPTATTSPFERHKFEAGNIQSRLASEGHRPEDVVRAVADHFLKFQGVSRVSVDEMEITIVFADGRDFKYRCTPWIGDDDKNLAWRIKRYQDDLDRGHALLFTGDGTLIVDPKNYQKFREELEIARDASKSIDDCRWEVLRPRLVTAIRNARKGRR